MEEEHSDDGSEDKHRTGAAGSASVAGDSKTPLIEGDGVRDASSKVASLQTQALSRNIDALKAQQAAMLAERKRVTKDLRNCEKRRKRLKANARRLSDEDLAEVLRMREDTKKVEEKPENKCAGSETVEKKQKKATHGDPEGK